MAFTLPDFNLVMDVWRQGHSYGIDPPDISNVQCQLYVPSKGILDIEPNQPHFWYPPIYIRVDTAAFVPQANDLYLIVHAGLDLFYIWRWWEFCHAGFPNEYILILVEQCQSSRIGPRH